MSFNHQLCHACRTILDRNEKVCPRCGANLQSANTQIIKRIFSSLIPSHLLSASGFLLFGILFYFSVGIFLFGPSYIFNPDGVHLAQMGSLFTPLFKLGEYWRVITSGFIHAGLIHLLFNTIVLFQVGQAMEREIGTSRFFTIYIFSLLGGGFADIIFRDVANVVGASGALFGLIGFGMSYGHFYGGRLGIAQRNFYLQLALYAFVFGFLVKADNIAHAGGFVVGALFGLIVEKEKVFKNRLQPVWNCVAVVCLIVTLGSFIWMVSQGGGEGPWRIFK